MISKFLDLKSGSSLCVCVGFLLPQTQTYIRLILKAVKYRYSDQVLNFSIRSYCVCTPLGFVTKYFLIFIADEVKNFVANNNHSSCWSQLHNRIHAKELVTNQRFVHQRKKKLLQDQIQLGIGAKVQLQIGILGQTRVVGKIPYTCNCLIVDQ